MGARHALSGRRRSDREAARAGIQPRSQFGKRHALYDEDGFRFDEAARRARQRFQSRAVPSGGFREVFEVKEQHREGVVLLLEKADGQIAFQLRDDSPAIMYPNHWGLLGGWTEANESPQQAAIREIEEELGYSLDAAKLVYLKTHIDGEVKSHILRYPVTDELRD